MWALPIVPVLVAVVRALAQHRVPLGDNGLIALRANDVLTSHQPWFGTWTSASLSTGVDFNNPLPLHFEWLALFVKPFGLSAGSVLGAASLNIAAIIVSVRQGRHAAGRAGEVWMAIAAGGLAWALGSEMLADVWQPHNLVLPFLAFAASCLSVAVGRWRSLPWAVGIGSLIMGTHLSFVYMVAGLLIVSLVLAWWHDGHRSDGLARLGGRDGWRRSVVFASAVGVAAWGQALWEQLTAAGQGNLSRVVSARSSSAAPIGVRLAVRLVAQVVALPPWWFRGSFTASIPATPYSSDHSLQPSGVIGVVPAACVTAVLLGALLVLVVRAFRRHDVAATALRVTALALLVISLATITVMPAGVIGLAPHQMRWLWPTAAFVSIAILDGIRRHVDSSANWRQLSERLGLRLGLAAGEWLGIAAVVFLSVANIPAHDSDLGPSASRAENATIRSLMTQLDTVKLPGPTWFDGSTLQFAEPVSGPVIAVLLDHGQPLHAGDASFARQLGEERRRRGDERYSLQIRTGGAATDLGPSESYLAVSESSRGNAVAVVLIDNG